MSEEQLSPQESTGPDPFVKRYLTVLGLLLLAGLAYWASGYDTRVSELNTKLAAAPALSDYPYRFRVLSLKNGVATMTSPRSAEMPPMHFLRILDPALIPLDVTHPDMMAAQDLLAEKQTEAQRVIEEEPDVNAIRWSLDEKWYREQGFFMPE